MKQIIFLLFLVTILSCKIFGQAIPKQISYQGVLKDASGNILSGDFAMIFNIYNDPTGGSALWTEIQSVSVANGLFSVQLGGINPITTVPFDKIHFLGITVGAESELSPRTLLSPSPYSFMSMNILDNVITTNKIQDGAITGVKIASSEVVKSINGLKDEVNLVAGANVTITPSGNDLTISATPGGGGTIGGSGTSNYLPLFTGTTTLGNSVLYQTGGNIGIGTFVPGAKFDLNGSDALINRLTIGRGTGNIQTNSAFGYKALYSNTTGHHNTANGYQALYTNTVGDLNTANGVWALYYNSTGSYNTANGYEALLSNTTGSQNTANGYEALRSNTIGFDNTANGYKALYSNTTGDHNTANGVNALTSNTTGLDNTANGYQALYNNSEGDNQTAIGTESLFSNTTGTGNTATGYRALYSNTTGGQNTAIGTEALYFNATSNYNTAIGCRALFTNTTGTHNTANGFGALYFNTSGLDNTANGYHSLSSNTTGDYNTASGVEALRSNTTGTRNTATGYRALLNNTTGIYNTANGYRALFLNTTENGNTAFGYAAGDYYAFSTGTFLGAYASSFASGYSNVMGLGYNSRPTASNQVRIGNSSVTSIGGYAGWTDFSDGRYKTFIQENVKGLDFIMKLRPITYQLDMNRLSADLKENQRRDENGNIATESSDIDIKSRNEKSQIVHTGFVAQEVERVVKELGFDFSGVDAPKNGNDFYGLRYAEFVVPLVKAVQEQQKIIEELTKRIEQLEKSK